MKSSDLNLYIDATFLKTVEEGFTFSELSRKINALLQDAILLQLKCLMIRPEFVSYAHHYLIEKKAKTLVGTVIDFPKGEAGLESKLQQAQQAIHDGADELDFVIDYQAFQNGNLKKVEEEVLACTLLAINQYKTIKWIIETAALTDQQIVAICSFIKRTVIKNFKETDFQNIYIKSSTGYYHTNDESPNGATIHHIILMLENAAPLPIKASGGISNLEVAESLLALGVKRIGTSSYRNILERN